MSTAAYRAKWKVDREAGVMRLVSSRRVTSHVRRLVDSGATASSIAKAAGVGRSLTSRIARGDQDRLQRTKADAILAVTLADVLTTPTAYVPKIGAQRRIRALLAIGWTHAQITERMGTATHSHLVLNGAGDRVTTVTHEAVIRAYQVLSGHRGTSALTVARAARAGYAPPAAWEDEQLDDPAATPAEWRKSSSRGADLDEWLFLVRNGEDIDRAARRCGVKDSESIYVAATRHERQDVLDTYNDRRAALGIAVRLKERAA